MAHQWQGKYDRLAPTIPSRGSRRYRAFTTKAIRYLAAEFRRRFPRTPILPTLGNDDSYCGDYMIETRGPHSWQMFAAVWEPLLGPELDARAFRTTSRAAATTRSPCPPQPQGHRLVVLDSVSSRSNVNNPAGRAPRRPPWTASLAARTWSRRAPR